MRNPGPATTVAAGLFKLVAAVFRSSTVVKL